MFKKLFGGRQPRRQNARYCDTNTSTRQTPDREEDGFVLLGESAIERSTVRPDHASCPVFLDAPPSYESQVPNLSQTQSAVYRTTYFPSLRMGQRSSNLVTTESSPEYVVANPMKFEPVDDDDELLIPGPPTNNSYRTARSPRTPRHDDSRSVVSTLPGEILSEEEIRTAAQTPFLEASAVSDVPFKLAAWLELSQCDWSEYTSLTLRNINLAEYQYDFSTERSIIKEFRNSGKDT